jgi:hypothetical protein
MRGCLEQSSSLDTGFSCSVLGWEWNEDIYIYMEIHLRSPMLTPRNCFRAAGLAPESAAFAMALRRCAAHNIPVLRSS